MANSLTDNSLTGIADLDVGGERCSPKDAV